MSAPSPAADPPELLRASDPHGKFKDNLGPLTELAGTWVGNGFNVMSLPDFDQHPPSTGPKNFRLKLNATREQLQFIPIGGAIPNRARGHGSGWDDGAERYRDVRADLFANLSATRRRTPRCTSSRGSG